jgi:hypothetical protein
MARPPAQRPVEWAVVLELFSLARRHWGNLTTGERDHVTALLRKSRGRPHYLTKAEIRDIRRLLKKLDMAGFGREAAPIARRLRQPRLGGR